MSKRSLRKDKGKLPPFVAVIKSQMDTAAWRALSHGAFRLYVVLKSRFNSKKENNGRIHLSIREAKAEMGGTTDSISRWFRELEHYGFIRMTTPGTLGVDGKGKAPHWRLTEHQGVSGREGETWMRATHDYQNWDGTPFRDKRGAVQREAARKQNPVPQTRYRVSRKPGTPTPKKPELDPTQVSRKPGTYSAPPLSRKPGTFLDSHPLRDVDPEGIGHISPQKMASAPVADSRPLTEPELREKIRAAVIEVARASGMPDGTLAYTLRSMGSEVGKEWDAEMKHRSAKRIAAMEAMAARKDTP